MFTITHDFDKVKKAYAAELKRRVQEATSKQFDIELDMAPDNLMDMKIELEQPSENIAEYINKLFRDATPQVFAKLEAQLRANMKAAAWGWQDGARDIVDTGALMDSQNVAISGSTMTISYSSEYAAITHYGGYIYPYGNKNAERVYLPARPWITATIQGGGPVPQFDFYQAYIDALF